MSGRRPWRVHVHDIGPNWSFADETRARELAARLVSGDEWTEGAKGLVGSYSVVTLHVAEPDRPELDREAGITLRRWIHRAGEPVREQKIGVATDYRWTDVPA